MTPKRPDTLPDLSDRPLLRRLLQRMQEELLPLSGAEHALFYLLLAHRQHLPELRADYVQLFLTQSITGNALIDLAVAGLLRGSVLFARLSQEILGDHP